MGSIMWVHERVSGIHFNDTLIYLLKVDGTSTVGASELNEVSDIY